MEILGVISHQICPGRHFKNNCHLSAFSHMSWWFAEICTLHFLPFFLKKKKRFFFFSCRPFKSLHQICYSIASVLCFGVFGWEACGILAPWPGFEPTPLTLVGEVLATGPSGKSLHCIFLIWTHVPILPPVFPLILEARFCFKIFFCLF